MKYETYEVIIKKVEILATAEGGPKAYNKLVKEKFALIGVDIDPKAKITVDHDVIEDLIHLYVKQPIKEVIEEEKCIGVFMPAPGQRRLSF